MTKILNDGKRIIFDGHAETREQCELITLVCNELAKSDKFNTIQYNNAYAEFEKIGNTADLKFAPASITIVFDSNINSVSATLHNSTVTWSTSGASNMGAAIDGSYYVFNVDLKDGYVLDTVVLSNADTQSGVLDSKTDNSFTILAGIGGIDQTITLTSKEAQSKKSIDLTTLSGWSSLSTGTHNITIVAKADGYKDSEPSAAVSVQKAFEPPTDCITFIGESSDFTLTATKEWDGTVEYSTDRTTWTAWNGTDISSNNKKLYLRGSGNTRFYTSRGAEFALSARAGCSGNLNTLLEYSNPPTTLSAPNCYSQMFNRCTNLTTAPDLPATTLTARCYRYMFNGCTSLTTAPELPATTLAENCYDSMFDTCTNLRSAPALPATTLAESCYDSMFISCASLTSAPELPATTLAKYCYRSMFSSCASLTSAPELPATTLATMCYYSMFSGCTNLTAAPELPATTLAELCYSHMFRSCTSLTKAPELSATTLAEKCYNSMFSSCTSLTSAPELPATTLATMCYSGMFNSCKNLTQAPALPATTLAEKCYWSMFNSCTNLKVSSSKTGSYQYAWRIPTSGTISSTPSSWSLNMLKNTGGTVTSDPSINTTYYVENAPV